MIIEYQDILINSENIEQYRKSLTAATFFSRWHAFDAQGKSAHKIIVYSYVFDAQLKISKYDSLRMHIDRLNINRDHIIAHEKHHLHNASIGHAFHVADGQLFTFLCLQCADEISARVAETLSKLSIRVADLMQSRIVYNSAITDAMESFNNVLPRYCQDFIANYHSALKLFNTDAGRDSILVPQYNLTGTDILTALGAVRTPRFYSAIKHYFTIDGVDVQKKLYKSVRNTANDMGKNFAEYMFIQAQKCIEELRAR